MGRKPGHGADLSVYALMTQGGHASQSPIRRSLVRLGIPLSCLQPQYLLGRDARLLSFVPVVGKWKSDVFQICANRFVIIGFTTRLDGALQNTFPHLNTDLAKRFLWVNSQRQSCSKHG